MLITVSGYDRAGKDTVYKSIEGIKDKLPFKNIIRAAHADWLKEIGQRVYGTHEEMKGTPAEDYYRMSLTKTSEVAKMVSGNDQYFAEFLFNKYRGPMMADDELVVCTDGRYIDEVAYYEERFEDYGCSEFFIPVIVTRPSIPPTSYAAREHNFMDFEGYKMGFTNDTGLLLYVIAIQEWALETFK